MANSAYILMQKKLLEREFDRIEVISPSRLGRLPTQEKPDVTFVWSPVVDGENFLLRGHLKLPPFFGSPLAMVIAPWVEFSEMGLNSKSLLYRNSIPHTYPINVLRISDSILNRDLFLEEELKQYPWVKICWHFEGRANP